MDRLDRRRGCPLSRIIEGTLERVPNGDARIQSGNPRRMLHLKRLPKHITGRVWIRFVESSLYPLEFRYKFDPKAEYPGNQWGRIIYHHWLRGDDLGKVELIPYWVMTEAPAPTDWERLTGKAPRLRKRPEKPVRETWGHEVDEDVLEEGIC